MKIKDKNFLGFIFAVAATLGLMLWGGLPATADDKGVNFTYEIDGNAADSGVTTTQGNRTIKDIQLLVGSSKKATLVFKHAGSGVTKAYTISSGVTLTDNFYLDIRPGAELVVNASSWIASPGHLIMAPNQRVVSTASTKTLYFTSDSLKYSSYNGGTTTVEMTSAKIDKLNLQLGSGVTKISTDGTLADNSDLTLSTEKAIKTYVAAQVAAIPITSYFKHNLKVAPPSSGTTTTHMTVTATQIAIVSTSGVSLLSGVSATAVMPTDLDTGVEAANTRYFMHLCAYLSGTTYFVKFSTSETTVTGLPSTAYRRCVGEVWNNSSSNFQAMYRIDDWVTILNPLTVYNNVTLLTTWTQYSLPSGVTPLAFTHLEVEAGVYGDQAAYVSLSCLSWPINGMADWATDAYENGAATITPSGFRHITRGRFVWTGANSPNYIWARCNWDGGTMANQSLAITGYRLPR